MDRKNDRIVQVSGWQNIPWLRHGFSTRRGGVSTAYLPPNAPDTDRDLNLGWTTNDDPANVAANRLRLIEAVGSPATTSLVTIRQIHSGTSLVFEPAAEAFSTFVNPEGRALREADGLMTSAAGILIGVQTADCVPVFVVDVKNHVAAAFHAGWRGTVARIVEQGIAQMASHFGSNPKDLIAAIGPSVGTCCYTVGEEVYTAFTTGFSYGRELFRPDPTAQTLHLDLWEANRRQLLDAGIAADRISIIGECTGCTSFETGRRRYFSHRCEHGFTGRMLNVIGISQDYTAWQ